MDRAKIFSAFSCTIFASCVLGNTTREVGTHAANSQGIDSTTMGSAPPASGGPSGSPAPSSSGGTSGDGGGPGTPVMGTPTVLPCDQLPAASGTWEEITPAGSVHAFAPRNGGPFSSGIANMRAQPLRPGNVLASGVGEGLFESTNCGAQWAHINTGANGDELEDHAIADPQFTLDPTDASTFYVVMNYGSGGVWKTTDGGGDWAQTFDAAASATFVYDFVNTAALDPTDPQHLVATPHGWCIDANGNSTGSCGLESTDGGGHWNQIAVPVWQEGGALLIIGGTYWLMAGGQNGLKYTENSGATWTDITPTGAGGANPGHYYSALTKTYYLTSDYGIMTSTDQVSWTLIPNSPKASLIVGTGTTIYACHSYGTCNTAPEADATIWTPFALPSVVTDNGSNTFSLEYDATHKVLYTGAVGTSSAFSGGMWRMVLP